jgi:DNA-directed RNA polymerase subunit L
MSKGGAIISNVKTELIGDKSVYSDFIYKPHKVSFTIKYRENSTPVANALRRAVMTMVPALTMFCRTIDIETDDKIISDFMENRLRQIPIDQSFKPTKTYSFEFVNNTDYAIIVTGADFFKAIGEKPFFNPTTQIIELSPSKYIKIKKIGFITGTGQDSKTFDITSGIEYRQLVNDKSSSLNTYSNMYHMAVHSNGNIDAKKIVKIACQEIITRLEVILQELNKQLDKDILLYDAPKVVLEKEGELIIYRINDEDHTIGNIITYHIFEQDKNIKLVTYDVERDSNNVLKIKINHPNHKKLITNSINICIDAFNNIGKAF